MSNHPPENTVFDPEALIIWPDLTWCYAHEIHEYQHMSDDYVVVKQDHPLYHIVEELIRER